MEFESIRPVLSGVAGGIIATWLTSRWSRRLPSRHNGKSRDALLRQHRPAIWTANTLFFLGLIFGVALYRIGGFDHTDWRPLGLGFGLASVLPLLAIFIVSILSGRDPRGGIRCLLIWPGHASLGYLRFTWRRLGCFCVCTCQPWHLTIHSSRRHFAARPNSGVSCYEQQFSVLSNNQYPMGRDAWGGNAA